MRPGKFAVSCVPAFGVNIENRNKVVMDRKRDRTKKKLIKIIQTNANKRIHLISLRWEKIFGTLLQNKREREANTKRGRRRRNKATRKHTMTIM